MDRRKFLATVGSLAAGGAAVTGTGAFTSVSANRDVSVEVADDTDALLSFTTADAGPNSQYVKTDGGTLSIDISGSNDDIAGGGEGINQNATTIIRDMFDIRNQGTQAVFVWQETNEFDDGIPFGLFVDYPAHAEPGTAQPQSGTAEPTTGFGEGESGQDALSSSEGNNFGQSKPARLYLEPGEALRELGTFFFGSDLSSFSGSIKIVAQAVDTFEGTVETPDGFGATVQDSSLSDHEVRVNDPTP
jgi:hypothetical protein